MAMSMNDHIEPTEEPIIRQIHPKTFNPDEINAEHVVISYDRQSDNLLIHLFGRDFDTVSVPVADYLSLLVALDTEKVVGFHIEGFLAQAVKEVPGSVELLEYAELRGITPAEVRELQKDALGVRQQLATRLHAALVRSIDERKKQAIASFIAAERPHWGQQSSLVAQLR